MNTVDFSLLEPQAVWRHFAVLCAIPRPSKHEAALVAHLKDWGRRQGLFVLVDAAGNILFRKPATPGKENAPGIVLQAHLDMVCQKLNGEAHDFFKDPICPEIEDGWLLSRRTTLGADNGIGVALALAALEEPSFRHGPLEVLLTVDEEAGMSGALALESNCLKGACLLNLDTEDWGQFYIGCAGGVEIEAFLPASPAGIPSGWQGVRLEIDGLSGGHSGMEIHRCPAHALRLLVEVLLELSCVSPFMLASLEGGSVSNALPRSASAVLALPPGDLARLKEAVEQEGGRLHQQWGQQEKRLTLAAFPVEISGQAVGFQEWVKILRLLFSTPYGPALMSKDFPDVVETSNNIAPVRLSPHGVEAGFLVRSLNDRKRDILAKGIMDIFRHAGGKAAVKTPYPAWKPRPDSRLLACCRNVYQELFGHFPKTQVIHAGLECGFFANSHPHLEMLSFGPDIRGVHAPGERVNIESVGRSWQLLGRLLNQLSHLQGSFL